MEKMKKLATILDQENIDFAFIQAKPNVFYLSNVYCDPHERLLGIGIFPDAAPFFICPQMEVSIVRASGWQGEIYSYLDHEDPWEKVKFGVQKQVRHLSNCAIEVERMTYDRVLSIMKCFGPIEIKSIDAQLNTLRLIKSKEEQSILQEAARLADYGVEVGVHALKTGRSESAIIAYIEYELKKKGVREMSFSTLVLSGENASNPHGKPGKRKIQPGDLILFDLGVVLDGYCSDITRTVAYQSVAEEQKAVYETVLHAQEAALSLCRPGVKIKELDICARSIIQDAGYGEYFPHRIGHGLGIDVHEFPSLHHQNEDPLEEGMCFTIEPGIYISNLVGVRIEDDVVITEKGHISLTSYPKDLQIIK